MYKALIIALVFACAATSAEARRYYSRHGADFRGDTRAEATPRPAPNRTPAAAQEKQQPAFQSRTRTERRPQTQNQGTAAVIPPGWQLEPPDPRWKGYRYRSPDGEATVVFYSTPIDQDVIADHWKAFAFRSDEDLMFLERGRGWVVASGLMMGSRTSYRKAALDCHERVWRHIELEFPAEARASFDPLIARVAHTLDFALANNWASTVAPADVCEPK